MLAHVGFHSFTKFHKGESSGGGTWWWGHKLQESFFVGRLEDFHRIVLSLGHHFLCLLLSLGSVGFTGFWDGNLKVFTSYLRVIFFLHISEF